MRFGRPLLACALSLLMVFVSLVPCFATRLPDPDNVVNVDVDGNGYTNILSGAVVGCTYVGGSASPPALNAGGPGMWYMSPIIASTYAYSSSISPTSYSWVPSMAFMPYDDAINEPVTWYFSYGLVTDAGTATITDDGNPGAWEMGYWDAAGNWQTSYVNESFLGKWNVNRTYVSVKNQSGVDFNVYSPQYSMRVDCTPDEYGMMAQVSGYSFHVSMNFSGASRYGYYLPWSYVIPTTPYLDIFDDIYAQLLQVNSYLGQYLPQLYTALNSIVSQLEAVNADTDTIIEILNDIKDLDSQSLTVLQTILTTSQSIDTTVKQIYATMVSEVAGASDLSDNAQAATDEINTVDVQETAWQNQMSSNFTQLELDNFSLGILGSGLSLVGNMFTSIWSAFGGWSIMFTFPLVFGVSLLVIGRISKSGGKGSSRDKDKGDDG